MVIVRIHGGLGNQLFQYAFAKELECRGKKVLLDYSILKQPRYKKECNITDFEVSLRAANPGCVFLSKALIKLNSIEKMKRMTDWYVKRENVVRFDKQVFENNNGYFLGFWQCEDYFASVKNELRNEIYKMLFAKVDNRSVSLLDEISKDKHSVSLHIRGGDYLNSANYKNLGSVCDSEYYKKAINICLDSDKESYFYIFTNDIGFAKKMIPENITNYSIIEGDYDKAYLDMLLMSRCKRHIVANSSFSWWGAWLDDNPESVIIAPAYWSKSGAHMDIVPKNWIKV